MADTDSPSDSLRADLLTVVPASTPIPAVSTVQLAAKATTADSNLSPTVCLQRLTPMQVIEAGPGVTVYYFLKVGAKAGTVSLRRLPPEVARQCAIVSVNRSNRTFNLLWYPNGEEPQCHTGLPFSDLPQAVNDLRGAGFR